MKTVGYPISKKENEKRRALLPKDIVCIKNKSCIYIEKGYGNVLNIPDEEYLMAGINVEDREAVLSMDIICDPKIGDAEYLNGLRNQAIFGWIHAVQNQRIAEAIRINNLQAIAWEEMFVNGRHTFWRNNEIAGEAAILHAYCIHGSFPYNSKVAILGRGNCARGAMKILNALGADVTVYNKHQEGLLREEISLYDVVVNAILWDTSRTDHVIYKDDLRRMKRGAIIIDISCDRNGAIESSIPTTIQSPVYEIESIVHYVVDHTPTIFYKAASEVLSRIVSERMDLLIEEKISHELQNAIIINQGKILDQKIIEYQKRANDRPENRSNQYTLSIQ
ncbi:MAG: N(5)-(carboxyethyl)ornithine synthase [Smithella sp. PtaU1.Bin162]|nr:MAG: N(5)-(carboxyethyl)ornithine synthase [Smithella sp. PtaU1.Bin162]